MKKTHAKILLDDSIRLMIRANRLRKRTVSVLSPEEVDVWNLRFGTVVADISLALINAVAAEHPSLEPTEADFKRVAKTVGEPRKRREKKKPGGA